MAAKYLIVLVIVTLASKATSQAVTEIFLPDHNVNYISNPLTGVTMTIPKMWTDSLVTCHVTFPNGITYEAYPENNLPSSSVSYLKAVPPFNACSIGIRGVGVEGSGTYELWSMVDHADESRSMTRRKFNLYITETELEFPSQ